MNAVKIAPELLLAFQDYKNEGRVDFSAHSIRTLSIEGSTDSPESPKVNVFLHCDESAEFGYLAEKGIQVNTQQGRVRTARLSLENLEYLFENPDITHVGASHKLHPLMDVASAQVQLPQLRNRTDLTGKGVIIGVVDTGIDSNHSAFQERILRIWDQELEQELTSENFYLSLDTEGHGTHVAGIAAGNDNQYGGVAPEAELVIVKSTLDEADISDGIRYIFRIAEKLDRPAVVNLSLGGHYDPHDGSDDLSESIDELSGAGKIVCCSAGNEGNYNIHAQVHLSQNGDSRSIRFLVPEASGSNAIQEVILNGWHSGRDHIEVAIQSPSEARTTYQGILQGNPSGDYDLPDAHIRIFTPEVDIGNQDRRFQINVKPLPDSDQAVTPGIWKLGLRGREISSGKVDMWVLDGKNPPQVVFTGRSVSDSMKIGSPGAARRAITVASYTTKNQWSDIDGRNWQTGLSLNDISDFSSEGPLRNGVQKPDVAAPGAYIASCMSEDMSQPRWLQINSNYTVMRGTSMSAPFISGIVALLLQHDPTFSPERIKALLQSSSSIPGNRPGRFHPKWGYGLIDADALADALVSLIS